MAAIAWAQSGEPPPAPDPKYDTPINPETFVDPDVRPPEIQRIRVVRYVRQRQRSRGS